MTNKQKEKIKDNLNAYKANFGYIEIASMKNKKARRRGSETRFDRLCDESPRINLYRDRPW